MDPRILVVEDDPQIAGLLRTMLELAGYSEVHSVFDGRAAITAVDLFRPDLMLCDLRVPGIDGIEIVRTIRRRPDHVARLPIIVITADASGRTAELAADAGADQILIKPFDGRALLGAIREQLAARGTTVPRTVGRAPPA